ncbi:MAG: transposase, partial [Deltaproteobacteria bacterium]|nr:transposase [Deltaproteobacteria bacterium]
TKKELEMLNELYKVLRLYTNFFQPVMKLVKKTRVGSKVIKRYDEAKTPYQRVLDSAYVPEEDKERLRAEYDQLNPAELKRELTKLKNRLMMEASAKHLGIEFK